MEATISVICFKSKTLANGEHPLMLRITKDRKRSMKSLGISICVNHWDFKKNEPKPKCPNATLINQIILKAKLDYQKLLLEKTIKEEEVTPENLLSESSKKLKKITVDELYHFLIGELTEKGKLGNSSVYKNVYSVLKLFNGNEELSFSFKQIDKKFLEKFEKWLYDRKVKETTISVYFRTLRAVYNRAIREGYISADKSPFIDFKVGKFNTKTVKRAITKEDVLRVINLELSDASFYTKLAQDIFTFSYLCGGISFVDIANLTASNIHNNRLTYERQKTHKIINIPFSEQANEIVNKYKIQIKDSEYLFPILNSTQHVTPIQKRDRVLKVRKRINSELHKIGDMIGLKTPLTTYVARHTFATVLKRSGVNIAIISESLGHSDLSTTQIYLDSFENSQIDEAMKNLL